MPPTLGVYGMLDGSQIAKRKKAPDDRSRVHFMVEKKVLQRIKDYRFETRRESRSAAIEALILEGLKHHEATTNPGRDRTKKEEEVGSVG